MERCPKCAGPVEWRPAPFSESGEPVIGRVCRALSDSLEDVETEAVAVAKRNRGDLAATLDEQHGRYLLALRRLFNGCATCGREPLGVRESLGLAPKAIEDAHTLGQRKAYQHAADMVDSTFAKMVSLSRFNGYEPDSDMRQLGDKLRQFAGAR